MRLRHILSIFVSFFAFIALGVTQRDFDEEFLDAEVDTCGFQSRIGRIIRVKDSKALGARFLLSLTTEWESDCQNSCCDTISCDLSVYRRPLEAGNSHNCYLFHCATPSVCVFSAHPSYNVSERMVETVPKMTTEEGTPTRLITTATTITTTNIVSTSHEPQTTAQPHSTTEPPTTNPTTISTTQAITSSQQPHPHTKTFVPSSSSPSSHLIDLSMNEQTKKSSVSNVGIALLVVCVAIALAIPVSIIYWRRKHFRFGHYLKGYHSHDDYLINGMYA